MAWKLSRYFADSKLHGVKDSWTHYILFLQRFLQRRLKLSFVLKCFQRNKNQQLLNNLYFHTLLSRKPSDTEQIQERSGKATVLELENNNIPKKDKMALAKIPDQMETAPIQYGPNADVNQEITEETTLREVCTSLLSNMV